MHLEITTPEKTVFKEEIDELIVPTENGEIAILPHHVNLLTKIAPGEMTIKIKGKEQHLAVTSGFLQIENNSISILADFAIRSDEIDAKNVEEAHKRAEALLKNKDLMPEEDYLAIHSEMQKAILQLKVANKRRRHATLPQT